MKLWTLRHGAVDFSKAPAVMGVLNVTPDSFSDGGAHVVVERALRRVDEMVAEGAGIIDIGPESTRPGSAAVSVEEQLDRLRPVLQAVRRRHPEIPVSIDTRSAQVAAEAIELGADIINDVSALRHDQGMASLARDTDTPVILMHMRGTPETMQVDLHDESYGDVVGEVASFLADRVAFAGAAGIPTERVAVDPGIGFGKTPEHNLSILRHLDALLELGVPVVVGASRKSFLGVLLDRRVPRDRVAGSLACAVAATLAGVHIIRVHDVGPTVEAVRVARAIRDSR